MSDVGSSTERNGWDEIFKDILATCADMNSMANGTTPTTPPAETLFDLPESNTFGERHKFAVSPQISPNAYASEDLWFDGETSRILGLSYVPPHSPITPLQRSPPLPSPPLGSVPPVQSHDLPFRTVPLVGSQNSSRWSLGGKRPRVPQKAQKALRPRVSNVRLDGDISRIIRSSDVPQLPPITPLPTLGSVPSVKSHNLPPRAPLVESQSSSRRSWGGKKLRIHMSVAQKAPRSRVSAAPNFTPKSRIPEASSSPQLPPVQSHNLPSVQSHDPSLRDLQSLPVNGKLSHEPQISSSRSHPKKKKSSVPQTSSSSSHSSSSSSHRSKKKPLVLETDHIETSLPLQNGSIAVFVPKTQSDFITKEMEQQKLAFYSHSNKKCGKFAVLVTGFTSDVLKKVENAETRKKEDSQELKLEKEMVEELRTVLQSKEDEDAADSDVEMKDVEEPKKRQMPIRLSNDMKSDLDKTKWASGEKRSCKFSKCKNTDTFNRPHLETHITKCHTESMALPYQCKLCATYAWNRSYDQAKKHIQDLSCSTVAHLKRDVIPELHKVRTRSEGFHGVLVTTRFCLRFEEGSDGKLTVKLAYPLYDECLRYRCIHRKSRFDTRSCNITFTSKSALDAHFKAHNLCNICLKRTDRTNSKLFRLHRDTGHDRTFLCVTCVDTHISDLSDNQGRYLDHVREEHDGKFGQWRFWGDKKRMGSVEGGKRKRQRV